MSYFLENQQVVWRDEVTLYNDGTVKRHEDRDGLPYSIDQVHARVERDALWWYRQNDWTLTDPQEQITKLYSAVTPDNLRAINQHLRKPEEIKKMPAKADLQAAMRELARQLAEAERFPEDTFADGTVLSWEKELPVLNTATREYEQKPYRWAAVKGSGKWYISTAKKAVQIVDYDTLCDLTDGQPVYVMVQGEKVVRARNEENEPEKLADVVGTEVAAKIEESIENKDSWVTRERPTRDAS